MSTLVPWLSVLAIGAGAFLVGKYLQREERKRRELRRQQQMANLSNFVLSSAVGVYSGTIQSNVGQSDVGGQYSAAQAMHAKENPQRLGRVQEQLAQSRFRN